MKLKHDKLLSNFAFDCNLRHYTPGEETNMFATVLDENYWNLASLVKLHYVTFVWKGGGEDVLLVGDVAGGWTHTLVMMRPKAEEPHKVGGWCRLNPG